MVVEAEKPSKQKELLDAERLQSLEDLGIDLSLCTANANKTRINEKNKQRWMEKYELLKEYRRLNGHCNVPKSYKKDHVLGTWVITQRKRYREMQKGKNDG